MNLFRSPLYASDHLIDVLALYGCRITELSEEYSPKRVSASLGPPLAELTPWSVFSLRQWLVEAGPSVPIALQSGLLSLGMNCLYESRNLDNNSLATQVSRLLFRPPGSWHRRRTPIQLEQPLVLLTTHNNPNFYHWLTQPGLSALFLQDYYQLAHQSDVALALSSRPGHVLPEYVYSLLDIFAHNQPIVEGLALSSATSCRFALQEHRSDVVVSPAQVRWLHRHCRTALNPDCKPWRRILISRQKSARRRCLNEDHLFAALVPHGFERYCLEDLTVIEQLRLFSQSTLLVGAHGAGFSNLVACAPEATIVEFLPRPGPFSHYYSMADVLGFSHGHLLATRCLRDTDDFTISPDQLLELLRDMGAL